MGRLIRMDRSGHTTLAEWSAATPESYAAAADELDAALALGYLAVHVDGESAEQVRRLPPHAGLVVLRRPIAGG